MADNSRSRDFRYVFANTFSIAFGPAEVQMTAGIQLNPASDSPAMEEQIGFIITHPAAKLLGIMLMKLVTSYEEESGTIIPLEESKVKSIDDAIALAKKTRAEAIAAAAKAAG
jgi:hypothetical protein